MCLLDLMYMWFLLNHTYDDVINSITITNAIVSTEGIKPFLNFKILQPVHYKFDDSDFPSDSTIKRGLWVGISENFGYRISSRPNHWIQLFFELLMTFPKSKYFSTFEVYFDIYKPFSTDWDKNGVIIWFLHRVMTC